MTLAEYVAHLDDMSKGGDRDAETALNALEHLRKEYLNRADRQLADSMVIIKNGQLSIKVPPMDDGTIIASGEFPE